MLTKEEWRTACIVALVVFGILAMWYSNTTADEYKSLYDSYTAEKHIADMMADVIADKNQQIDDLNQQIVDLKEQLPK